VSAVVLGPSFSLADGKRVGSTRVAGCAVRHWSPPFW